MNKNTLITMAACLATIVVLAGIVVWAESRLSSSSKAAARQEIETILAYSDEDAEIQSAILMELNSGGQVFFLHNRVASIEAVAQRISALVPAATIAIGHGQMQAAELRGVMDAFTRGEANVLVATTIIENGLDIPTAGTILIDDADRWIVGATPTARSRRARRAQGVLLPAD